MHDGHDSGVLLFTLTLCVCWQGKNFLVAHPHTQDLPASGKLMQHALYNTCTALRGGVLLGHEQVRAPSQPDPSNIPDRMGLPEGFQCVRRAARRRAARARAGALLVNLQLQAALGTRWGVQRLFNTCNALRGGVLLGHEQVHALRGSQGTQTPLQD